MQTTYKEQIDAIRVIMKRLEKTSKYPEKNPLWIALNDAASTIASMSYQTRSIGHV